MEDAQEAARKPAVPAMMSSQTYLSTLTTMSHQGSFTVILAAAAFSGSSTMERICSVVSLTFIGVNTLLFSVAKVRVLCGKGHRVCLFLWIYG